MKKIFFILFILILFFIFSIFGILFTNYGNSLVASYIENRVNNEQDKVELKVDKLNFTFKTLDFNARINDNSYLNINGNFELFNRKVDLKYDIKINELEKLKNLLNYDFKGSFFTNGSFVGDEKNSIIKGVSNFASGETNYNINLVDFEINNVILNSKNLKIEEFLSLLNKPIYSKGILNIDTNINNFKSKNINGNLVVNIEKGFLNNEVVNKEFNQTLSSNVSFESKINSTIVQNKAISNINLNSSLFNIIFEKFELNLLNSEYFGEFNLFVKELQKLESFIGKKLKGEFNSKGLLKSANNTISVEGFSNILESESNYKIYIKDRALDTLEFKIKDAKVENFLKLLDEPIYAMGNLEASGKINNLKELNGNSLVTLKNIKLVNEVINAVYNQNINETIILDSKIDTIFENNSAISNLDTKSNIANLNIKDLIFDFKTSNLVGKYNFTSDDLSKLKDFTKTTLKGDIKIDGNIKTNNNKLILDGKSNIAKGNFDFILNDNILNINLKDASMRDLLILINQKDNFDAKVNMKLNYNLFTKKGDLLADFLNGHFLENDFTRLVKQFANTDLTKEVYETSKLNTKIDDKVLTSNLFMQSQRSKIEVNNSKIDLEKNIISAKIDTEIKDNKFSVSLENDLHNPALSFDLKDVLQKNIDKLGEKLNKFLGK